jgi:hypothetical protein
MEVSGQLYAAALCPWEIVHCILCLAVLAATNRTTFPQLVLQESRMIGCGLDVYFCEGRVTVSCEHFASIKGGRSL